MCANILKVAVATVGAVLPNNIVIKKATLRRITSYGMLCSAQELGLSDEAHSIMELPEDAPLGANIRDYLDLDDVSIALDLTPNRSDCLSVLGVAREVGALTGCDVASLPPQSVNETIDAMPTIKVDTPADCPLYMGRVIKNIHVNAATPLWMQEKLRRSGLRSLGAVIDIVNYVMLELGQPMHAFDLATLTGDITVRLSERDEKLTLLNGQEVTLNDNTLVIADQSSLLALAGIMGGQAFSVSQKTQHLFLESAFFTQKALAGRARYYGLHTDASHRFERGVDPNLAKVAMDRATSLLLDIVGGDAGPITTVISDLDLPKQPVIHLRSDSIKRILGIKMDASQVEQQLTRLCLQVVTNKDGTGWQVTVPSFRFDLAIEVDLIEELARLYGYDKLPQTRPPSKTLTAHFSEKASVVDRMMSLLADRDYQEAVTYSFVDPAILQHLTFEDEKVLSLANPISADLSVMRTSLWAGLVQALVYNINRQQQRVRLFEVGCVFSGDHDNVKQDRAIAGIICGNLYAEQWAQKPQSVDFFDIKADVEALLALGNHDTIRFVAEKHPALHTGQSARVYQGEQAIGWVGALHPRLSESLAINARPYLFELNLSAILFKAVPQFASLSKFPMIRRDLALIVDLDVTADQIVCCLNDVKSAIVRDIQIFDVYIGTGIEPNKKSIAIACFFQHSDRTLTEEDVDSMIAILTHNLYKQVGAVIRS